MIQELSFIADICMFILHQNTICAGKALDNNCTAICDALIKTRIFVEERMRLWTRGLQADCCKLLLETRPFLRRDVWEIKVLFNRWSCTFRQRCSCTGSGSGRGSCSSSGCFTPTAATAAVGSSYPCPGPLAPAAAIPAAGYCYCCCAPPEGDCTGQAWR